MTQDKDARRVFVSRRLSGTSILELTKHAQVDLWELSTPPPRDEIVRRAHICQGLLAMPTERIDGSLLDEMPNLRVIANMAVGVDNIDVAECTRRGIAVGNTPRVLTDATANLAWALILAVSRRLLEAADCVRNGNWPPYDPSWLLGNDLAGKTLGVVGFGEIGRAVAARASAFGLDVIHHSRSSGVPLDRLLESADVVSLHVPLTEETEGLLGRRELQLMKPTAILINTARGAVVRHDDLLHALRHGWLMGAGLDVTYREPLPRDDPILSLPNCIVLPHIGSATHETRERMASVSVENVIAGLNGQRLPNPVN